jgi:hypothetical protein
MFKLGFFPIPDWLQKLYHLAAVAYISWLAFFLLEYVISFGFIIPLILSMYRETS